MPGDEEQVVTPPEKPEKQPEQITLTKAEHAALIRERDEARESERFWAQRARGVKEPEPEEEEEEIVPESTGNEDIDRAIFEDPDKWTEALTKGPKAIGAYIKSLGLVSAKEAAEIAIRAARQEIKGAVQGMQTDSKLVGDFADLKDKNSELFKLAAPIYQEAVAMNGGKQSSALLWAAAKAAKAQLDAQKKPQPKQEDPYERYDEEERQARADAQGARRGRPAPIEDESEGLGPEALAICKQMGVKPEDFLKSQKELGTRRRR